MQLPQVYHPCKLGISINFMVKKLNYLIMEGSTLTIKETMNLTWFDNGFFAFPNIPENTASGEIIIGSLYRELGLAYAKEGDVGNLSKKFKDKVKQGYTHNNVKSPADI